MAKSISLEKVWFVISLVVLSFLYGAGVGQYEWFPYSTLKRAADQARSLRGVVGGSDVFAEPQVYERKGVRVEEPEDMQPNLTLISSAWKGPDGWDPELRLIDRKGEVLHSWRVDREKLFQGSIVQRSSPTRTGVHGSYLLPDGEVVLNLEYVGMVKLDACGDVLWEVAEGNHHAISQADDGSFWSPGVGDRRRYTTPAYPDGYPGLKKPVWMDQVLHISKDGEIVNRINVLDVLKANGLERYLAKGMGPRVGEIDRDPIHLNDVEPLSASMADEYPLFEAGDLLLSLRYPDLVFVLDPETTKVKWYESRHFTRQHDPDFIGEGWIGVFDNQRDATTRGALLGGTRIVKIQPHTDSLIVPFPTSQSEPHYTQTQGKWQQLANGNMLLVESDAGRIVEVAPNGRTVWEWIQAPTGDSMVPTVTKAIRTDLTREDIASWSCSSVDSGSTPAQKH